MEGLQAAHRSVVDLEALLLTERAEEHSDYAPRLYAQDHALSELGVRYAIPDREYGDIRVGLSRSPAAAHPAQSVFPASTPSCVPVRSFQRTVAGGPPR